MAAARKVEVWEIAYGTLTTDDGIGTKLATGALNKTTRWLSIGSRGKKSNMRVVDDYRQIGRFECAGPGPDDPPAVPFLFNAPHSGTAYTRRFLRTSQLDRRTLRRSEDTFVDDLFVDVPRLGAVFMRARFPRVFLDVNRQENELDPQMFDGPLSVPANPDSPRVAGGLGVIAKIVADRQPIYAARLPAEEAEERLREYYRPYHAALAATLGDLVDRFGFAVLIDCHSMPSNATRQTGDAGPPPDIVLGDRFGASANAEIVERLARLLRERGYRVGRNRPYAGGFITERYGRPPLTSAIQLELNRALYMDEATYHRRPTFAALRADLLAVAARLIAETGDASGRDVRLAAE